MASPHVEGFNKDALTMSTSPDNNYGSKDYITVLQDNGAKDMVWYYSIVLVDFSELTDLTAGSQVVSATCTAQQSSGILENNIWTVGWYRARGPYDTPPVADWGESTVTHNNMPGFDISVFSEFRDPYDDFFINGGLTVWDIKAMIVDAVDNRHNIWNARLMNLGSKIGGIMQQSYWSREGTVPPYITITYTVGGAVTKTRVMVF